MANSVTILVLVLVGLPASGKSTLARALVTLAARRRQEEEGNGEHNCLSSLHYIEYDGVQASIMTGGDESFIPEKECIKTGSSSHPKHQYEDDDDSMLDAWRKSRLLALGRLGDILRQQLNRTEEKCRSSDDTESLSSSSFSVVLVDDNFHLRSMRKQVYQTCQQAMTSMATLTDTDKVSDDMANNEGGGKMPSSHAQERGNVIYFGSVYINTPVEVCVERNRLRREQPHNQTTHLTTSSSPLLPSSSFSSSRQSIVQQVSDDTILRLSQAMEPPAVGKASWEVDGAILTLNGCHPIDDLVQEVQRYIKVFYQASSQSLVTSATPEVLVSLPPPVRAIVDPAVEEARLEEERRKTRDCLQHQLELASRQWVAAVARIRPQQARVANQIRKEMLASFQHENEQNEKLQLQKRSAASTTMASPTGQHGNNTTCNHGTNLEDTLNTLRHQFAEKVVCGHSVVQEASRTSKTTASFVPLITWTDEEKELLWMELSS